MTKELSTKTTNAINSFVLTVVLAIIGITAALIILIPLSYLWRYLTEQILIAWR